MQTKFLGQTGVAVSRFCLGTMMFGARGNPSHEDCTAIIHRALDAGVNFIDTADMYSRGESEEIVGKALKGRRVDVILATKFSLRMSDKPNDRGGSRNWIVHEVEQSLRRLQTDYIDLYQLHRYDPETDLSEVMFTLTELVRQGKIRYFGSSMFSPDRIVEAQWIAERKGLLPFRCEQPWYSIFVRDVERFVLPACNRYGMGAITWSPLDAGYLSGKYKAMQDLTSNSRVARFNTVVAGSFDPQSALHRTKLELAGRLDALAREAGITLPQMAVAFVLAHPYVTASIIGPRTMEQFESLLPAADLQLSADVLDRIDQLVPPGTVLNPIHDAPDGTTLRRAGATLARGGMM